MEPRSSLAGFAFSGPLWFLSQMDPIAPRCSSAPTVINEMHGTARVLFRALESHASGRKRDLPDLDFFFFDGEGAGAGCVF